MKEDRWDGRTDETLWDDYFIAASEKKGDVFLLCYRFFVSLPTKSKEIENDGSPKQFFFST